MTTTHDAAPSAGGAPAPVKQRELKIISHSTTFYWWPVWLVGFLMGFLTLWEDHRMAVVPTGAVVEQGRRVEGVTGPRDVIMLPEGQSLPALPGGATAPEIRMSANRNLGGFFVLTLLLVILITNISMRGIWSLVAILLVVALSFFFAWVGWWGDILRFFGLVHIFMNASGYFVIAGCVLLMWLVSTFVFDRLIYSVFTPGQFRVHLEVGEGETAFDVLGMVIHKRRNDLFRHWLLGLGSGDLIVKTGGAHPQTFEIPNVLFIGRKVDIIEQMLQEREVVEGQMHSDRHGTGRGVAVS
jgi:hypothetical protein